MKIPIALLGALIVLSFAGCGHKSSSSASASSGPQEVDLTANDQMRYNITSIEATPGEQMKVVLTNIGSSPASVMEHNWVLLKQGSNAAAFSQAAVTAKADDYIPPSLKDEIVAMIPMQGPHSSGEVDFKAPMKPGVYPYLCTFPAHYQTGMHGTFTVK
ncbi:MAG: plastocyanin/azurin family copper-binding protein [Opitutaceae bacterium]